MVVLAHILAWLLVLVFLMYSALILVMATNLLLGHPLLPRFIRSWWTRRKIQQHICAGRISTFIIRKEP